MLVLIIILALLLFNACLVIYSKDQDLGLSIKNTLKYTFPRLLYELFYVFIIRPIQEWQWQRKHKRK